MSALIKHNHITRTFQHVESEHVTMSTFYAFIWTCFSSLGLHLNSLSNMISFQVLLLEQHMSHVMKKNMILKKIANSSTNR